MRALLSVLYGPVAHALFFVTISVRHRIRREHRRAQIPALSEPGPNAAAAIRPEGGAARRRRAFQSFLSPTLPADTAAGEDAVTHGASPLRTVVTAEPAQASDEKHPLVQSVGAPTRDTLQCLRCQLLGRRRLTCSRAEVCRAIPHFYPIGPVLLAAWLATAVAFVIAAM